jgi:hypothetical protein
VETGFSENTVLRQETTRKPLWIIAFWLMADKPVGVPRMAERCTARIFESGETEYGVVELCLCRVIGLGSNLMQGEMPHGD